MKKILLFTLLAFFLFGCGGKNYTVTQVDSHAYILIKGDTNKEKLFIDNSKALILGSDTSSYSLDSGENANKIRIKEGTHILKIMRDGKIIINRKFYVSPGNTFEVNL